MKKILMNKYGLQEAKIKNWPLGRVIAELKNRGVRQDLVRFLEELKEYRNYIAHELLVDDAIMRKLAGSRAQRFAWKRLSQGLCLVEQTVVVHDVLAENGLL
jgi:hypothetical protein